MKELLGKLKGDKGIWAFVALLSLFSFMPVFSASTNLVYVVGNGSIIGHLIKHLVHVFIGFCFIYFVHRTPYHYFKAFSWWLLPVVIALLGFTMLQGTTIGGANASRWLKIPFVGVSFQPSAFAFIVMMVYVARYLSKIEDKEYTFKSSFIELWLPVFGIIGLILPANFSTAALMFSMVCMLVFVGRYRLQYLFTIIGLGIAALLLFVLIAKAFPDNKLTSRVNTWMARIERFSSDVPNEDDYQIEKAKIAIASGKVYGLGPGKSVQKNFLPQSSSDFIFAIIVEEYGLIGGLAIMGLYLLLFFRFLVASHKAPSMFGKLLIVGLGFPIVFQAFTNMGVAVELLPTTGQTLPLISSGGTSIWMTCIAIGIILSVTKKEEEVAQIEAEAKQRDEALQRIIDREVALEEEKKNEIDEIIERAKKGENYSIEDQSDNPMNAVLGKE
ncbi:FtsW/RodA/SpoVE family cell cycle protein [Flavobacterium pedocola]